MRKYISTFLAVAWMITVAVISLISLEGAPKLTFSFADKIIHAIVYCIFSIVWFYAFFKGITTHFLRKNALLASVIFGIMYGILIEILQETVVENRQGDWQDVLANVTGTLFAVLLIKVFIANNRKLKTQN